MVQAFDKAAFLAAARKAAEVQLQGVTLPGIGHCWVRPLTAGDWVDAQAAAARLRADGVAITPRLRMAIGLAQNLCGPEGEAIFAVDHLPDLQVLAALPMDAVGAAMARAGELNTPATGDPRPNA